jgi:hypothetical protein
MNLTLTSFAFWVASIGISREDRLPSLEPATCLFGVLLSNIANDVRLVR